MSDTVNIIVSISTDKVGSECTDTVTFSQEEWDDMTASEQHEFCKETAFDMMQWHYKEARVKK